MKLEAILWKDAHSQDIWQELRDLCMDPLKVLTIGIVVKETDETVAVSVGLGVPDNEVCTVLIIPKGMIVKRQVLGDEKQIAEWSANQ